jgi:hypothetical protein
MMLHLPFKKSLYRLFALCAGFSLVIFKLQGYVSSLDKFDPFPYFSARDPQSFLLDRTKLKEEGADWWHWICNHCEVSVSGYFQNAHDGKPFDGGDLPVVSAINGTPSTDNTIGTQFVPLGDLVGRTPMIPLTMSTNLPDGTLTTPPTVLTPMGDSYGPLLTQATNFLFKNGQSPPVVNPSNPVPPQPNIEDVIDPGNLSTIGTPTPPVLPGFGFFSLPYKHQQRGARADILVDLFGSIGLHIRGGFASVAEVPRPPINETGCSEPTCPFDPTVQGLYPGMTFQNVNNYLMNEFDCIIREIGMSNKPYQKTGFEELMFELYWRYPCSINRDRDDWLQILAIPYLEGGFSYSPAGAVNPNELYGHMLGNNKHWAAGLVGGFCFDFVETVEIGAEIGYTGFFGQDFPCFRVPNSKLQNNIFPFTTGVNVQPGHNMHYALKLTARNFLEKLSGYFQFVALEHKNDCITLLNPDPAFVPDVLAGKTGFKVKVANIGFTYPLSPNFIAGFFWQAPLSQRNAARTTTIMFGLTGTW